MCTYTSGKREAHFVRNWDEDKKNIEFNALFALKFHSNWEREEAQEDSTNADRREKKIKKFFKNFPPFSWFI